MSIKDDIKWFKTQFGAEVMAGLAGTPFSLDLISAIAYQESAEVWSKAHLQLTPSQVLEVCVGDVIGKPKRGAFPKDAQSLKGAPNGEQMYDIARQALVDLAAQAPVYKKYVSNPERFCHAYGIFQYDIQVYKNDESFFLNKEWGSMTACISKLKLELEEKLKKVYGSGKTSLTPKESVFVAIAYNSGHVDVKGDFKQGYKDSSGVYYGEYIWEYLQIAEQVVLP